MFAKRHLERRGDRRHRCRRVAGKDTDCARAALDKLRDRMK
jgi:hypothetical protein